MQSSAESRNSTWIARCTVESVSTSTLEVASSKMMIREFLTSALQRATSWRSPAEKFVPSSDTVSSCKRSASREVSSDDLRCIREKTDELELGKSGLDVLRSVRRGNEAGSPERVV